ncbi:MAG: pimeloyl-ACP methyl ester carboxylesterase [Candidatus Azotimanducaceae bacterium]
MEQHISANGIDICYESFGHKENLTVLFVMGLGAQMVAWPESLITGLVDAGFHVVRYDNRDVGLSQKFDSAGMPDFESIVSDLMAGKKPISPYYLSDMAADGIGLMDALGISQAHVVGASMGGMIAQQMAIESPERLLTMTSIMSTTGDPSLPSATEEAMAVLMLPAPDTDDINELVAHSLRNRKVIGGDGFVDDEASRNLTAATIKRQNYPIGSARQRAAIMSSGPRTEALKKVTVPTLVLHGDKDPLVTVEGGIHTAKTIPGARLEVLAGMGHALFPMYQPRVLELIKSHIAG